MVLAIHTITRSFLNSTDKTILYCSFTFASTPEHCPSTTEQTAGLNVPLASFKYDAAASFFHDLNIAEISTASFFHPQGSRKDCIWGASNIYTLSNFQKIVPPMLTRLN
jgi:hypothetical protein